MRDNSFRKIVLILILISIIFSRDLLSQEMNMKESEKRLNIFFNHIMSTNDFNQKESYNDSILSLFQEILQQPGSFEYPFDSLKNVGTVYSDDNQIKFYTWNLPLENRKHHIYGFIQIKIEEKIVVEKLIDQSEEIKNPERLTLTPENWYGALYYDIIDISYRGAKYYTLLGYHPNDLWTKKKIIDIFYIKDENPYFGALLFRNRKGTTKRIIFEYSARVSMMLKYDHNKEMIVYDHLSPSKPSFTGQFEFYGPDFSYDGLKYEKGIWNTYYDLDLRNNNVNY